MNHSPKANKLKKKVKQELTEVIIFWGPALESGKQCVDIQCYDNSNRNKSRK